MIKTNLKMRSLMGNRVLLFLSFFLFTGYFLSAQERPEVPAFINFVSDFADVLSEQEEQALNAKIKLIRDSTVTEIAIVIETTLNGRDVFDRSMDFARAYKVGAEGVNSGVLIYVAIQEHKIFIQNADKTQGALTDYITKLIIDRSITPEFKSGNYYQGLDNGVESIYQALKGEFNPDKVKKKKGFKSIFFIIIIALIVLSLFGRGGGNGGLTRGGGYFLPGMLLGGMGGGGGSGGGGGGFGGFGGGGGFSGGGAGGSW